MASCADALPRWCKSCLPRPAVPPPAAQPHNAPQLTHEQVAGTTTSAAAPAIATESTPAPGPTPAQEQAAMSPIASEAPKSPNGAPIPSITAEQVYAMDASAVLLMMQNSEYQLDASLMAAGCKQLRLLCRKKEGCDACDKLNAASSICKTMSLHIKDPSVQQQGCAALINLCAGESMQRRVHASNGGALRAIVEAMDTHIEYPGVQEMAFVAIQNVTSGGGSSGQSRRAQAIESGALRAIINAVHKFEEIPSVVDQGTATLRLLCAKNPRAKAEAISIGAKKEWLKSPGVLSNLLDGLVPGRKQKGSLNN